MSSSSSDSKTENKPCQLCGITDGLRLCSQCKNVSYCGEDHQKADWPRHKTQCRPVLPDNGSVVQVMGILFAANEDAPRLVSVNCKVEREIEEDDDTILYRPDFKPFLGNTSYDGLLIHSMGLSDRALKHPLRLFIRDNFFNDGSPRNMCVDKVLNGRAPHNWCGNLLAMKQADLHSGRLLNATMKDLPTVLAFMKWYPQRY